MRFFTLTLLVAALLAGEELPLPTTAQRHIDTLNTEIAKAEEEKIQKVNRAVDKAIKSLNNLVREAKTAQERRAIDDEILRLEKIKTNIVGDLLGENTQLADALAGEWDVKVPGWSGTFVFYHNGKTLLPQQQKHGTWRVNEQGNAVRIEWSDKAWDEFSLPIQASGVSVTPHSTGRSTGTAVKKDK